jgi:hypothetical protein
MKPSQSEGQTYNATRGGSIPAASTPINDATLRIEACVLGSLCGGENGVRAKCGEVLAAAGGNLGYVGACSDRLSRGGPMRAG